MAPIWVVPIIVSILVILWKVTVIRRSSNKEGHLFDLIVYVGAAFLLYVFLYWLGVEITQLIAGVTFGLIAHVAVIIAFLVCYISILIVTEREMMRAGPEDIEPLVKAIERLNELMRKADKGYEWLSERMERVEGVVANRMADSAERIDGGVQMQKEENEALRDDLRTRMKEFAETSAYAANECQDANVEIREQFEEWGEMAEKMMNNQRKNVEALREEVKSFRGAAAEAAGHRWEDVIADRVKKLGFDVEIGRRGGEPDVVIKDDEGNVLGVVGCKSYSLQSRRGMSEEFNPEVEFAKEEGVPLAVAIQNRLNDLEFFKIYDGDELDDFRCSAPTWLAGEDASGGDKDRQARCRREFKDFIARIS